MGSSAFSRLTRRFSLLLACSVTAAAALVIPAGAAPGGNGGGNGNVSANAQGGGNTNASVNLDQCRNGGIGSTPQDCDADGWDNGNLNPNQAHYHEGQSAPYRLVMEGLPLGEEVTVVLEYDVMHSGKHAIDFLTHYDRIDEDVVPTDGVTGISATVGTYPIPAPGSAGSSVLNQPTGAFNDLPAAERVMTLFGGDINDMAYVSEGNLASTGNAATQVSVTFVADSATAVLAWGGHIASPEYWGAGNSASGVSGSPYHMSVVDWTLGNVGRQDRSMQAAVVLPSEPEAPAQLTVTKTVTNDDAGTGVVGDFQLFVDQAEVTSGSVNSLAAGSYTVSEGPHTGYVSTIGGDCAADGTITLTAGQVARCTITNDDEDVILPPPPVPAQLTVTKVVVNDDGGTGTVADFDLFVGGDEVTSGAVNSLPAGSYTVSEGPHAGYVSTIGGGCAANGVITLTAGQVAECIITNDDVADDNPAPGPDPDDNGDPGTNPGTDPIETVVESATQTTNNPGQPVQTAPVSTLPSTTGSPETPGSQTAPTLASELPRTGAGVREQGLLALALLAAGLLSSALGRRRTCPSDV